MPPSPRAARRLAALLVLAAPALVAQGAPGHAGHAAPAADSAPALPAGVARADVTFLEGMIGHHAQALVMTDLLATRTARREMRLLAERIAVSQRDEIAAMRSWLLDRGLAAPLPDTAHRTPAHATRGAAHHGGDHARDHAAMPGMLTTAQLDSLAAARGGAFDTLFLRYMIAHHEGALVMVQRLFATPGAGQEPQLFGFATDVDADQRAEIQRMRALLARYRAPAPRRR